MSQLSEMKKIDIKKSGKKTQDDIVYEHIFDAILEQRLAPNTKLNEESLGDIFGVSRTIIRRALSRLSYEQVVVIRPNRGAVVASPSNEDTRRILFARRVVEKAVVELVCDEADKTQIEQLKQSVRNEQACFEKGDRAAGIRLSGEFHLLLAEIANNPPLLSFQRSLVSLSSLAIAQYENHVRSHCSYDEHYELIEALANGDKPQAAQLMMHHLDHIEEKLDLDDHTPPRDLKAIFSHVRK
ncbi:GntR family transcriptional regulator [Amphritea sp. 1_MG-2023]|uniref:GntR family transcriptional regulator n=1 Tax=Amphritea sp. 1_MG-2023 TaxID=3062670 RepID=UPI0026E3EB34|nr:GntR family transcriptional regulator [Amphritea sp. 1_MG-2023]MDO6564252.1 GntR family transcriptional regulator [Amphritea sp. 1_MG-2023]